jgi:tRNA A37 threonylcarbamoyladenosine dehydratase
MTRLHRTRLLFGDNGTQKLQNATVMVVGCGAVGSFAIEALARSGIGHLIVVDFDTVEESNINRQLFALDTTVGQPKVSVAANRIRDINPEIHVTALNIFFDEMSQIDAVPDFIIDAIDTVESKIALYKWASDRNIPIISSMGAASKLDVAQIKIASLSKTSVCPLAARVRRMVRNLNLPDIPVVYSSESPQPVTGHAKNLGSVITVTGCFGLMLANYVIGKIIQDF